MGTAEVKVSCNVLPIASGSSKGMLRSSSRFQRVSVDFPEPLAPAMMVRRGRVNVKEMKTAFYAHGRREFLVDAAFQGLLRPELLGPSFVRVEANSQPCC